MTELRRDDDPRIAPGDASWSWVRSLAERIEEWLRVASAMRVAATVFVGAIVLSGVGYVPIIDVHLTIARDPFGSDLDLGRFGYLADSPFLFDLAHLLGLDDRRVELALLGFALLTVAFFSLVAVAARVHGPGVAKLVAVLFFATPIATVMLGWLGQPDPITFAAAGFLVILPSRAGACASGFVLGANHFEVGVFVLVALVVVSYAEPAQAGARRRVQLAVAGLALVAGCAAVQVLQLVNDQSYADRLDYLLDAGPARYVAAVTSNVPALVFSLFGAAWVIVVWTIVGFAKTDARVMRLAVISLGVAVAPMLVALDSTRVFALVSWAPLLALSMLAWERFGEAAVLRVASWMLLAGLVVPRVVVWAGGLYASGWHRTLQTVLDLPATVR